MAKKKEQVLRLPQLTQDAAGVCARAAGMSPADWIDNAVLFQATQELAAYERHPSAKVAACLRLGVEGKVFSDLCAEAAEALQLNGGCAIAKGN